MTSLPKWAAGLAQRVIEDEGYSSPPAIRWRRSRRKLYSSGVTHLDGRIVVTAGRDRRDQKLTLLHELAHWLTPIKHGPNGRGEWHSPAFWDKAFDLYRRYGVPMRYALSQERGYRIEAAAAYRRNVAAAKIDKAASDSVGSAAMYTPPKKPITKPRQDALALSLHRGEWADDLGEHDGWIADRYVTVRPVARPENRTFKPFPAIASVIHSTATHTTFDVMRIAVFDDPKPLRETGPKFGGTKRKPGQGVAVRFADGQLAVYSKFRFDYLMSQYPAAALRGGRYVALQFQHDGELVGLLMPYFFQDGNEIQQAATAAIQRLDQLRKEQDEMDDLLNEGADLIDDEDAPVATAPKPKAKVKAKAKTRKPKATTKRRTTKKATAKKAGKTKSAKASANSNKSKRERHAVVHQTPKAGSKFTATYKGKQHTMTVKAKDGGVVYVVKGGEYKSPSAAALPVVDRERGPNGWTFWGIE